MTTLKKNYLECSCLAVGHVSHSQHLVSVVINSRRQQMAMMVTDPE